MMPRGDWKSAAADRLQRMGRGDSAKALYGVKNQHGRPTQEMSASEMREAGKRREAMSQPKSRLARLRAWLRL